MHHNGAWCVAVRVHRLVGSLQLVPSSKKEEYIPYCEFDLKSSLQTRPLYHYKMFIYMSCFQVNYILLFLCLPLQQVSINFLNKALVPLLS